VRVTVCVKPGSKVPGVEQSGDTLIIKVRERAIEGAATDAVIRALAEHYNVAQSRVQLLRGARSKTKVFEITLSP
jgi:uncharacterized protein YggU (UPF0235/DUF167 family)